MSQYGRSWSKRVLVGRNSKGKGPKAAAGRLGQKSERREGRRQALYGQGQAAQAA